MSGTTSPDAIVLACWPAEDQLLAQLEPDSALMPMGDKPMLQRVLEQLVNLGCKRIAVVHGHRPQEAEDLLGDGQRWGCSISHHYAAEGSRPLRLLAQLAPADGRSCVLARADTLALDGLDLGKTCVAGSQESGQLRWTGWAILAGKAMRWLAETAHDSRDLGHRVMTGLDPATHPLLLTTTISSASVAATLYSLPRLFERSPGAQGISRRPHSEGVWIGNGSRVHPSARLLPPVFIGQNVLVAENARIGPCTTIGDSCIVDAGSQVEHSVLLANTYVGRKLEAKHAVLSGNTLINSTLGVAVRISDPEFLRNVENNNHGRRFVSRTQRVLAAMLWLALTPVAAALRLRSRGSADFTPGSIGVPCAVVGAYRSSSVRFAMTHEALQAGREDAWTRHFLATFQPGLVDVIAGKVALIGLQPRSVAEIVSLPYYWQRLYRRTPTGLMSEALLLCPEGAPAASGYAADALGTGPMPLSRILRLLHRYAARVMTGVLAATPVHHPGTPRNAASQTTR